MKTPPIISKDESSTVSEAETVRGMSLIGRLRRATTALTASLQASADPAETGIISKRQTEGFDYETLNAL